MEIIEHIMKFLHFEIYLTKKRKFQRGKKLHGCYASELFETRIKIMLITKKTGKKINAKFARMHKKSLNW